MKADNSGARPCIYVSLCGDCSGQPEAIRVHLLSGDSFEIAKVVDVQLTEDEIVLRPADGPVARFPRKDVYYAGCARCLPPFLS